MPFWFSYEKTSSKWNLCICCEQKKETISSWQECKYDMLMWTLLFLVAVVYSSEDVKFQALLGNKDKMILIFIEYEIFGEGPQIWSKIFNHGRRQNFKITMVNWYKLVNFDHDHSSTVNLKVVGGKIFMKLIFVVKCSYRCQETTISNPPESLGGGHPFCARKDLAPRANFRKSQNLVFCFSGQVRHQNKGFLTRGIDCRWSQILKTFHFRSRLDFYIFR